MRRIVVIGSSNTDMILRLAHIPVPGETVLGGTFATAAGGKGANQAVAAARLGSRVTFVACVGSDVFGQESRARFVEEGIEISHVRCDGSHASGVAFIFVDARGENCIGVAPGANAQLAPDDVDKALPAIHAADAMVMQLEIPMDTVACAAAQARQAGVCVVLNPAPAQALMPDLLRNVSVITPNETEAEIITGIRVADDASAARAAEWFHAAGVGTAVITLGSRGAYYSDIKSGRSRTVQGFRVRAVDSTAAGDAFNGALAVALAEGRALDTAVVFANAAAALSVTIAGAQPSIPRRADVVRFLEKHAPAVAREWSADASTPQIAPAK